MLKLLVLLTVAALSNASDYGKIVGEWKILTGPKFGKACVIFGIKESGDKCICDGKEVPVLSISVSGREPENTRFIAVFVNSDEEVEAARQKNAKDCSCGEKKRHQHVFKVIQNNFILAYADPEDQAQDSALFVQAGVSKPDFEEFIKNSEFKNKTLPCEVFSS